MISKFFIDRPIFANVIAIVIIILGLVCLFNLPVSQYPNIVPPTIQVTTSYPGASADVVATTVGIPIEQAVNGVKNSIYMSSTSGSDGSYILTVTFAVGTDLDTSLALVQNFVNGVMAQLPQTVQAQGVTVREVSTNILQVVSLYSDDDRYRRNLPVQLRHHQSAVSPGPSPRGGPGQGRGRRLVQHAGVAGPQQAAILQTDHHGRGECHPTAKRPGGGGATGGPPVPSDQAFQFTINALGRLSDAGQFENIIVKMVRGEEAAQIVRVKDLARVELSQQSFSNFSGLTGIRPPISWFTPCRKPTPSMSARKCVRPWAR